MNKKVLFALILVLVLAFAVSPSPAGAAWGYRLVAGQNMIVGWVFAWADADNIYVQFNTQYKWGFCLTETHLHVADTWEEIPQNNGNPTPGQFDYKGEHDCVPEVLYTVPLGEWGHGDDIAMAAHAVVENWDEVHFPDWEETAWGVVCGNIENNQFPGANWAVFAPWTINIFSRPAPDFDYSDFGF